MDNLTTSKIFSSNFLKMTEEDFTLSFTQKPSITKSLETDENQFSFSFNKFLSEPKAKPDYKLQFGLNLLNPILSKHLLSTFTTLKGHKKSFNPAKKVISLFKLKKKRAAFIKWYVQSIKLASEFKVQSAFSTVSQLNSFSRKYISCSLLFNLFYKSFHLVGQKFFTILSTEKPAFNTLIPARVQEKWISGGLLRLFQVFNTKALIFKSFVFKQLANDLSLQRQAFIQNTDRCILLSEQLFQAKEAKEKVEFEKEELIAVLESKTDELNNLIDIVEEYKTWKSKLNTLEVALNDEIVHWKTQASKFSAELDKKNKEIIEVFSDKKKAEEECLKAYRSLDLVQRENLDLQQKANGLQNKAKLCEKCENLEIEIKTYEELVEEFKKSEEKFLSQIRELQDQVSRPVSVASSKGKVAKVGKKPVKKTLELDKQSISENENQLAIEIVNLNKHLTKYKYENKTLTDLLKKCQQERDELKKLMLGKDDALARLRKENDQLCLSLSNDHYKSVHKLEQSNHLTELRTKDLQLELTSLHKSVEDTKLELSNQKTRNQELELQIEDLKSASSSGPDNQKLLDTLNTLQSQFFKLKEMSDKQIQTIETLRQDNFHLMQSVDSFKSLARSSKLHADKAANDSEAYISMIKNMENEINQLKYSNQSASSEISTLKDHIKKLLATRS